MTHTTTLQAKGQITLPREARQELGVRPGDKMVWVRNEAGHWEIWRAEAVAELLSSYDDEFMSWSQKARRGYAQRRPLE